MASMRHWRTSVFVTKILYLLGIDLQSHPCNRESPGVHTIYSDCQAAIKPLHCSHTTSKVVIRCRVSLSNQLYAKSPWDGSPYIETSQEMACKKEHTMWAYLFPLPITNVIRSAFTSRANSRWQFHPAI